MHIESLTIILHTKVKIEKPKNPKNIADKIL